MLTGQHRQRTAFSQDAFTAAQRMLIERGRGQVPVRLPVSANAVPVETLPANNRPAVAHFYRSPNN